MLGNQKKYESNKSDQVSGINEVKKLNSKNLIKSEYSAISDQKKEEEKAQKGNFVAIVQGSNPGNAGNDLVKAESKLSIGKKDQLPILVIEPCNEGNDNEREVPKQLMQ